MSGGTSYRAAEHNSSSEAQAMRDYAVEHGVATDAILLEEQSADTGSNAYNTLRQHLEPRGIHAIIVVTSGYHVPRAEYIFKKMLGPDYHIQFVAVPDKKDADPERLEREKRVIDFTRAVLDTVPDGDAAEAWRRLNQWRPGSEPDSLITVQQWKDYADTGKPVPRFPSYT
jgi:hypothetical protein